MNEMRKTSLRGKIYVKHGFPFKGEHFSSEGKYIVLTPGNFEESGGFKFELEKAKFYTGEIPSDYICNKGDLIVAMTEQVEGLLGSAAIVPEDDRFLHNQRIGRVIVDETNIHKMFLYHLFKTKSVRQQLRRSSSGSKVKHTSPDRIYDVIVDLPTYLAQKAIASVLSALDAKIEINNRINAELEAIAKTLYDYWFVQFDFPDKLGKPYKASGGKMVWNKELKREIPESWEVKRLGNIFEPSLGGTPSTKNRSYWENGTVNWLISGEVANFPVIDSELKITEAAIHHSATNVLPRGTVLLSITRHLRPTVLAIDACANQSVVGIKENGDLKYYFAYPYIKNEIRRLLTLRTGAQQPHINKDIVDASLITIPSEESNILKLYNSKIGSAYEQIINNAFQNRQLADLRDWLLPMLMNGQVRVRGEIESQLAKMSDENKLLANAS